MALFDGIATPKWVSPQESDLLAQQAAEPIGRNFLAGMQLAAQIKQHRDQLDLQTRKFVLEQHTQDLNNQQTRDEMDDAAKIQIGQQELNKGNFGYNLEGLKTLKGQTAWARIRSLTQSTSSEGTEFTEFMDRTSKLTGEKKAAIIDAYKGITNKPWPPRQFSDIPATLYDHVGTLEEQQRQDAAAEKLKLEQAKQAAIGQRQVNLQTLRNDTALAIADTRALATVESAAIRASTAAFHAQKWMSHAQWTTYKARLDAVNAGVGKPDQKHAAMDKIDKEFGVGHTITDENQPASPPAASPATPSKTLKWNPATDDFE